MFNFRKYVTRAVSTGISMKRANKINLRNPKRYYSDEPTEPFDNLPFKVTNRYTLTFTFAILFGIGLWAPYPIVWYLMAKRTM